MRLGRSCMLLFVFVLPVVLGACSNAGIGEDPDDPGAVVEEAATAYARGFTSRDLSSFADFFISSADGFDMSGTLDAARQFLASMPDGAHMEIASFTITGVQRDPEAKEAVVGYEAVFHITLPGDPTGAVTVKQDVALQWENDRWLITGGDPAQVEGQVPQPEES